MAKTVARKLGVKASAASAHTRRREDDRGGRDADRASASVKIVEEAKARAPQGIGDGRAPLLRVPRQPAAAVRVVSGHGRAGVLPTPGEASLFVEIAPAWTSCA